jgi:hypothetical protein
MLKKHDVTQIAIDFSGPLSAADAQRVTAYRLILAGKKGSFAGKHVSIIKLKSAVYDAAHNEVIVTPRTAFRLAKPVEFIVYGSAQVGLHDSSGRLIDGGKTGEPGSNAVVVISRAGVGPIE